MSGPIPAWLGDLTRLEYLNVADNELSGPIPPQLGNLVSLWILDLSRNELSGPAPDEILDLFSHDEPSHRFVREEDAWWSEFFSGCRWEFG